MLSLKYIRQKIKANLRLLLSIFLIGYTFTTSLSHASLACVVSPESNRVHTFNLIINRSDPIGHEYDFVMLTTKVSCKNVTSADIGKVFIFRYNFQNAKVIQNSTYESEFRGIGLKQAGMLGGRCSFESSSSEIRCPIPKPNNSGEIEYLVDSKINLVKLDSSHDTGVIYDLLLELSYRFESSTNWVDLPKFGLIDLVIGIKTNSCTLVTTNINFNLGKQQQKDFMRIGPIGREQTQQIAVTCDPNTKYSLKVDGDAEPGHPGVIKLTPESGAATGVGVQLLTGANKDPVEFGKAKEMGHTAASGTDIKENIEITARYYQTAPTITPGSANASATYTMTYQ
ncbi:fimbrial protein [Yersinia mollaretii]|uniref:fimbrial protein n=1 Tax=Yersinia mollaretii TaxID=33060 RepID=UPI0021BD46CA|nr:fimbrial protein [Yersinia mollaretii]